MQYHFEFNGKSSLTQGIYVKKRPDIPASKEKVEYISLPGRAEKLCRHTGEFENIELKIECNFKTDKGTWYKEICTIREWLQGYGELSLQDSAELFWKVRAVKIDGIERELKKYGFFTVSLPERRKKMEEYRGSDEKSGNCMPPCLQDRRGRRVHIKGQ